MTVFRYTRTIYRVPKAGEAELREMIRSLNERYGYAPRRPQPCTCAVNHGWH